MNALGSSCPARSRGIVQATANPFRGKSELFFGGRLVVQVVAQVFITTTTAAPLGPTGTKRNETQTETHWSILARDAAQKIMPRLPIVVVVQVVPVIISAAARRLTNWPGRASGLRAYVTAAAAVYFGRR